MYPCGNTQTKGDRGVCRVTIEKLQASFRFTWRIDFPPSLSLSLSLCGPSIDSIFGRETLVSVEIEWPTNCREKEKKGEGRRERKTARSLTSAIIAHFEHLVDLRIRAITVSLFLV